MKQLTFEFHNKKVCKDCGQEKSLDQFNKSVDGRDGFRRVCKECINTYYRQHFAQNPKARKRKAESCQRYRLAHIEKELERGRRYHAINAKERNAKRREYYVANIEQEHVRCRNWRKANPEKIRILNRKRDPEKLRAASLRWAKANRDKRRIIDHRRRARKMQAQGTFTTEDERRLYEICNHRCLCCGATEDLTIDHIIPLSRGGANSFENCQVLCRSCNSRKRTKIIDYRPKSPAPES